MSYQELFPIEKQRGKIYYGGLDAEMGVGGASCDRNEEVRGTKNLPITNHKPRQARKSVSQ